MRQYVCQECGEVFTSLDAVHVVEQIGGEGWYAGEESHMVCPVCGCDSIGEAEKCTWCGERFGEWDTLLTMGETICKSCAQEIGSDFIRKFGVTEEIAAAIKAYKEDYENDV